MTTPTCRSCGHRLTTSMVDLGSTPLANSYIDEDQAHLAEPQYPLHARVCDECLLVQVDDVVSAEAIFGDYAYFSSYSSSWVEHARRFVSGAVDRLGLGASSLVVEAASNDGYLLQHLMEAGVPCLGVEPAANVAAIAADAGVPTLVRFFDVATAEHIVDTRGTADLFVANNVLAHVPDLNGFVAGIATLLGASGLASIEVPHLLRLMAGVQFDTIYHEHFSYFSVAAAQAVFVKHGLDLIDVERLDTHGGSVRLWLAPRAADRQPEKSVDETLAEEEREGLHELATYRAFAERVAARKKAVVAFLAEAAESGMRVAGYGAAAKGNTLLNHCGIGPDLLPYVVDRSPYKQNRLLPGSRIPVLPVEALADDRPDRVLLLAWNLAEEIRDELSQLIASGSKLVTTMPTVGPIE